MSSRPIRVLIADDHQMFRDALRAILETEPDITVVGEAGTAEQTLRLAEDVPAEVLLLDLGLPDGNGAEVLAKLTARHSSLYSIVVSGSTDRQEVVRAIKAGARGVVMKDAPAERLVKSIRHVAAGEQWFGHQRLADLLESVRSAESTSRARPFESLTAREREIVAAVVQGATNKDISKQFSLRESTVKNHLTNIFDKLGVANRLELALFAVHHHLFDSSRR